MGKNRKRKIEKHTSQLHVVEAIPHVTAVIQVKMADDREPPALFDEDVDTPEAKPEEQTNGDLFVGETTEITLDDAKKDESPEDSDKATGEGEGGDQEEKAESSAAASVDVTNLSKPSKDESEPEPKEKAEVGV